VSATDKTPADGHGRLFHLKQAVGMSGAMLTAVVALASGGLALLFQLRPDLLPDPRTHLGATAHVFAVDTGVPLSGYLKRRQAIVSESEYQKELHLYVDRAGLGLTGADETTVVTLPGEDVFVNLKVEGFKSRSIAMLASIYNLASGKRVPQVSDWSVFQEQLNSPSDQSVVEFWLPAPPVDVTKFFVRVEVYHHGDGVLLAVADSTPISHV
jgi:hypothetical protein